MLPVTVLTVVTKASNTLFTHEQIEYAKSLVLRKVTDTLQNDLKSPKFRHKPQGLFGIGFSLKGNELALLPIQIS